MVDQITNFVPGVFETTLSSSMGATDTTATVVTTVGAPASPCYMVIDPENDAKREIILFDDTFTGTTFVTTDLANRFLAGSAAGSGLTHAAGAVVRFSPVGQMFEDLHARITADAALAIQNTLADAAGDLLVASAADTWARLAKGTALQVLRVNAGATGLEYADPASRTARAYRGTAFSVPNSTITAVTLDNETFDTDALHDNVTNNTRIVLNKIGKWLIVGQAAFVSNGTGSRQALLRVNGVNSAYQAVTPSATVDSVVQVASVVSAAAITDYAELGAFQTSGGSLDLVGGAENTWLSAVYLGA